MPSNARVPWTTLLVALLAAACSESDAPAPSPAPAGVPARERPGATHLPSILLITLDTTRADALRTGGAARDLVPVLDALAGESIVCSRAMAVAPMTQPSHTSMLTGVYPFAHGVHTNGAYVLGDEARTLAELLGERGYHTEAFLAATVLHRGTGLDQGFEEYHDVGHGRARNLATELERPAAEITDQVLERLEALRDSGRPWFFWVHYFDPHFPYAAPGFPPGATPRASYESELRYLDRELGRLLSALRESGDLDRTAVVLTADHGEGLDDGMERTHGFLLEPAVMRVPFLVRSPGATERGLLSWPTSGVDVFPTCLAFAEATPDAKVHGRDVVAMFRRQRDGAAAPDDTDRAVYLESQHPYHALHWAPLYGITTARWQWIGGPGEELRALGEDGTDLGPREDPARAEELRRRFEALTGGADLTATAGSIDLSPAEAARLRTLGYLASSNEGALPPDPTTLPDPRERYPDYLQYEEAFGLAASGRYGPAVEMMRPLVERYPDNPWFLDRYGRCLMGAGRMDEGMTQLRRALDLDPEMTNSWYFLGRGLAMQQEWTEAEACLDRALELFAGHLDALLQRGEVRQRQGRAGEALLDYVAALGLGEELDARSADAARAGTVQRLRRCLAELAGQDDAERWLERARERAEGLPEGARRVLAPLLSGG